MEGYLTVSLYVGIARETTILFVTRDSWGGSCGVMARSFPCHNKVSGPSQRFLKQRLSTAAVNYVLWALGLFRPPPLKGPSYPNNTSQAFLNAPNTLHSTTFHRLISILFNVCGVPPATPRSFPEGSVDALQTHGQITPCFSMNWRPRPRRLVSAVVLGENATFTLNRQKCFPRPQSRVQLAPSTFFTRLTSVPILSSHRLQKDDVFNQSHTHIPRTQPKYTYSSIQTILQWTVYYRK